jgi:hypothetical protein
LDSEILLRIEILELGIESEDESGFAEKGFGMEILEVKCFSLKTYRSLSEMFYSAFQHGSLSNHSRDIP